MKSGPKPKRKKTEVIETQDGNITPPAFLNKEAKEVWRRYADDLIKNGRLTPLDVAIFAGFCDQLALIEKCHASMNKRGGMFSTNGYGTQRVAPEIRILNQATEMMLRFAKELGMTPKSRGTRAQFRVTPPAQPASPEKEARERRARLFKVVE